MQKVLVTGMSGKIGTAVRARLEGKYELSALNRRDVPGIPTHQADVSDFEAIRPAFEGKDAVIHLSGALGRASIDELLNVNVRGTYNVYEASLQAGVKRVVFASSTTTIVNYEKEEPYKAIAEGRYDDVPDPIPLITADSPVRPQYIYSCTKLWGEDLGRYYSDNHGLSIICLRFGLANEEGRPTNTRMFAVWQSMRDAAQSVQCCLEAPEDMMYGIFTFNSNNKWSYRDIEPSIRLLGYKPQDSADDFR